jgi:acetyl-CoA carboxylase carboxyl transferase subunit beta
VEATIRQKLPADFQCAEFLLQHGMIDRIVPRAELRDVLGPLLACYAATRTGQGQSAEALPAVPARAPVRQAVQGRDAWEVVKLARRAKRPTTLDYIDRIFDQFHPLYGDRLFGEDAAIVGGLARLGGVACVVVGTQKGRSLKENLDRNFGMPHPEGYRKALRLFRHAAKFRLPVVTFIDTLGAYPGQGAEERGQALAIAQNLFELASLPVPLVSVLTGEGGSGGALALAATDRVLMLENAYYSVITPEGCAVILFKEASAAPRAARELRLTADDLERLGLIDEVVPEPAGGAHIDAGAVAQAVKGAVVRQLRELLVKAPEQLLAERRARYRAFGAGRAAELTLLA